jgi:hypothetical protein
VIKQQTYLKPGLETAKKMSLYIQPMKSQDYDQQNTARETLDISE